MLQLNQIQSAVCITCNTVTIYTRANDSAPIQPPPLNASTTDDPGPDSWVVELLNSTAEVINTTTVQDPNITYYLFTGLMKGTRYGLRVAGGNDRGFGVFSIIVNVTTLVDRESYVCAFSCK